jgi:hypothetical protein
LLSAVSQRISEKNVIVHNRQENFNRERSAMLYEISTLKWKLSVGKQKVKTAGRNQKANNGEEGEAVCRDGGAGTIRPEVGPEQAEERRSKSLGAANRSKAEKARSPCTFNDPITTPLYGPPAL